MAAIRLVVQQLRSKAHTDCFYAIPSTRAFSRHASQRGGPAASAELLLDSSGAANKQAADASVYSYIVDHTREPEVLRDLRSATAERLPHALRMQVTPEQGAFLAWLVGTLGARRVIEVGVFTGYSSIAMALAMNSQDGRLVACDRDEHAMATAREFWLKAGVAGVIEERLGPALATLQGLLEEGEAGTYDFAFIDADKRGYREYYELLLQLVRPGGVIAVDNVLWYGKVADAAVTDKATQALRELNDFLATDARVRMSLVPIGDGMTLCTRL